MLETVKHLVLHSNPWVQFEIKCKVQIWGGSLLFFLITQHLTLFLCVGVHLRIMVGTLLDLLLGSESSAFFHRPQWQTSYGHPVTVPL